MLARCLLGAVLALLLAAPAQAAVTAKVSIAGSRLVVTVKGAKPRAVTVVVAGKSHKLTKRGSKWRSKAIANAAALAGSKLKVRVRTKKGSKTLTVKVAGTPPAPTGPTTPTTPTTPTAPAPTPTPTPTGPQPVFPAPAQATTGNAAFEAIKGYLADSRFTDCVAGWPNCAIEERYSHFANGDHYYCRLTMTSGSDIRSYGSIEQISGAEHKADGSWGVEYYLSSYGNTVFYSWSVSNMGVATGRYWGPGRSPASGAPDSQTGPLQWVRGAKDCSY